MFDAAIARWELLPDGPAFRTLTAHLLPVRYGTAAAMLKIATNPEERRGAAVLAWWAGDGAVRVLARHGAALLMERAEGGGCLARMARDGRDDEACRILCGVAAALHHPRPATPPRLVPLAEWFAALDRAGRDRGGLLARCAAQARSLLASPRETVVLHGDLHHGNVLDCGGRGWAAIDPKGLLGERGLEFAPLFANPDLADPRYPVASAPGRLARRLDIVSAAAGLERRRLAQWVLAWGGLSAAWFLEDGEAATLPLAVAACAARLLDG
jgi:streptomycin 6-kinase